MLEKNFNLNERHFSSVGKPSLALHWGENRFGKEDGYRREFIYSGISGTTIFFIYREYSAVEDDNFIENPYTMELRYDIKENSIVKFKDTTIKIVEATSEKIEYEVLSWGNEKRFNDWINGVKSIKKARVRKENLLLERGAVWEEDLIKDIDYKSINIDF